MLHPKTWQEYKRIIAQGNEDGAWQMLCGSNFFYQIMSSEELRPYLDYVCDRDIIMNYGLVAMALGTNVYFSTKMKTNEMYLFYDNSRNSFHTANELYDSVAQGNRFVYDRCRDEMSQQDFTDAFILYLSGIAEIKNDKEVVTEKVYNTEFTIEFPTSNPEYALMRKYVDNKLCYMWQWKDASLSI